MGNTATGVAEDEQIRKVAIIGGGSAGVAQARQLLQINDESSGDPRASSDIQFEPTIFERRPVLGSGLWALDADPGECHVLFSSTGRAYARWDVSPNRDWPPGAMYDGLRTNIPADLMAYRDSPFDESRISGPFPTRGEVETYLKEYAQEDLRIPACARVNTSVKRVVRANHDQATKRSQWSIESLNHVTHENRTETFDYVVFANGRTNIPSIPPIYGLWNFQGKLFHSAWYRTPLSFRGQKVLIVGNNSSGMDVGRELNGHIVRDFDGKDEWLRDVQQGRTGVTIINSVEDLSKPPNLDYDPRDPDSPEWSRRIQVVPRVSKVTQEGVVVFEDGQEMADVDTIVFATGFYVQYESIDQTLEPFKSAPLVKSAPPVVPLDQAEKEEGLVARLAQQENTEAIQNGRVEWTNSPASAPAGSGPSSLDDWYLFYEPDQSMAFLGLPAGNVPFPLTHVQARFVAAYWSGKADTLPPIDREIPPTEGSRWFNYLPRDNERPYNPGPMPLIFGHPSDMDYLDGLLAHMHSCGGQAPWEKQTLSQAESQLGIDASEEEVREHLDSIASQLKDGPEYWYNVTAWRRKRRRENLALRRKYLGY
ncbi:unnamed protein product [Sympodiomycopsis kandeliae]